MKVYDKILDLKANGKKALCVLIDPDSVKQVSDLMQVVNICIESKVDFILIGGSLLIDGDIHDCIERVKENCQIPVIIFPGNHFQIDRSADAILFLSLISGRNPELLIGQHVISAPIIKKSALEPIPTGYILVNAANHTSVSYMSHSIPIPSNKPQITAATAIAGEMLGLKMIYLEAGSGAKETVDAKTISSVRKGIDIPIMVGGGINSKEKARRALDAGADLIVVGNALEKDPYLIDDIAETVRLCSRNSDVSL